MALRVRNLLLWLSTVDRDVLEGCPREATKFVAAGGAVLMTTGMALIAGTFAAYALLHLSLLTAIVFGLGWSLAIMNLERYVQASIRRQRTVGLTLLQALPRVALAFALGFVISKPLLLQVFQPEVKAQVSIDRNAQYAAAHEALKRQFAAVPGLQATIAQLEDELNTPPAIGKALGASSEYHALAKRYGTFQAEARNATSAQKAQAYERAAQATLDKLGPMREELLAEERVDNESRKHDNAQKLRAAQAQLAPLKGEFDAKNAELAHRFEAPSGLADADRALGILEHSNSSVSTEALLLTIFIIAVDVLPAVMKTLMSVGRRSLYEEALDAIDEAAIVEIQQRENLVAEEARRETADQLRTQEAVRRARSERQTAVQIEMDERSIRILQETIEPYVERWARVTAERYGSRLADEMTQESFVAREHRARSAHEEHADSHRRSSAWNDGLGRFKRSWRRRPH